MIEKWFETFTLMKVRHRSDGMGGQNDIYAPGVTFQGALTYTCGDEIPTSGQAMLRKDPTLLHEFDVTLIPGDYVFREKDRTYYRVCGCSDDMRSPAFSGLRFGQVNLERVVTPGW